MVNSNYDDKILYFNNLSKNWDEVVGNDAVRLQKIKKIFEMMHIKNGDCVLDVGCGTGVLFPIIQEYIGPNGSLIAVDASDKMIEVAKERHKRFFNIQYIVSPLEDISLPHNSIDVILCFAVFPHIEDKLQALKKCHECLKQNGLLYIFHLSDTKTLNDFHHNLNAPVSRDYMPYREEIQNMLHQTGFIMKQYIDQPELNFIHAEVS
ncbi:MAG: methyltransferase domain-containing protein [Spirochaetes bacterium]|nr:methyltransferase domain-containing protein [Spirochaetota bacterium]